MQHTNRHFWQRVLTAPGSLNIEPPPKMPSILLTVRPFERPSHVFFFSRFFPEENHNPYRSNGVYTTRNATCTGLRGENPQATFFLM